jgi:hypothetical protein
MDRATWKATRLIIAFSLIAWMIGIEGCTIFPPVQEKDQVGFWSQSVQATGWGFHLISPYGVLTFGYLSWCRNANPCYPAAAPVVPVVTPPATK